MPEETSWIRVRDKDTGHQYDVRPAQLNPDAHERLNASKAYPDLTGPHDQPRPIKYATDKAGQPATTTSKET